MRNVKFTYAAENGATVKVYKVENLVFNPYKLIANKNYDIVYKFHNRDEKIRAKFITATEEARTIIFSNPYNETIHSLGIPSMNILELKEVAV